MGYPLQYSWASLVAQLVKNPPASQETWVQSLGWEDPLEDGMTAHWLQSQTRLSTFHFHFHNAAQGNNELLLPFLQMRKLRFK